MTTNLLLSTFCLLLFANGVLLNNVREHAKWLRLHADPGSMVISGWRYDCFDWRMTEGMQTDFKEVAKMSKRVRYK